MNKTLRTKVERIIKKFANNPETVKRIDVTALCDKCGISYTAKYETSALIDFLRNALETADKLDKKADAIETADKNNDADAPALVDYTKHDVTIANYPELVRIATRYGIETAGIKCADLRAKILTSGVLSVRSTTSNGDGIRARNALKCQTFITALLALLESIGFVKYDTNNKLANGLNGYTITHNGGRIALNIDGLVRFTLFVQSSHLNIATRPADALAIGYTDGGKDGDPVKHEYGYLNYGKQTAFIKSIEYTVIDENNPLTADNMPADLKALFELYGIEFICNDTAPVETASNETADNETATESPAPDDTADNEIYTAIRNEYPADADEIIARIECGYTVDNAIQTVISNKPRRHSKRNNKPAGNKPAGGTDNNGGEM